MSNDVDGFLSELGGGSAQPDVPPPRTEPPPQPPRTAAERAFAEAMERIYVIHRDNVDQAVSFVAAIHTDGRLVAYSMPEPREVTTPVMMFVAHGLRQGRGALLDQWLEDFRAALRRPHSHVPYLRHRTAVASRPFLTAVNALTACMRPFHDASWFFVCDTSEPQLVVHGSHDYNETYPYISFARHVLPWVDKTNAVEGIDRTGLMDAIGTDPVLLCSPLMDLVEGWLGITNVYGKGVVEREPGASEEEALLEALAPPPKDKAEMYPSSGDEEAGEEEVGEEEYVSTPVEEEYKS